MISKDERIAQIEYVVQNSDNVRINQDNIDAYVNSLKIENNTYWLNHSKLELSEKELILLMFIIESMNFCFWKKPFIEIDFKGEHHKRSMAMFYSVINKALIDKAFLKINNLLQLTKEELITIFGGKNDLHLTNERYSNLIETVKIIYNKKDSFYSELFSLDTDEKILNYIITNFPSFNDVSEYKGKKICFYKRATLLVRDLFEVSDTIKSNIKNTDNMLGCADYGIPRTLRHYGILEYNDSLSNMVDNKIEIAHNSNYEIEIRANMMWALELIKNKLLEKNIIVNSVLLDSLIWLTGRDIQGEHHLTETIYY